MNETKRFEIPVYEESAPETVAGQVDAIIEHMIESAKRTPEGELVDPDLVVRQAEELIQTIKNEYPHVFAHHEGSPEDSTDTWSVDMDSPDDEFLKSIET